MADNRSPERRALGASDGPGPLLVCLAWVLVIGLAVVRLESRDGLAVALLALLPRDSRLLVSG